jgi:hypothetical protein
VHHYGSGVRVEFVGNPNISSDHFL